MLAEMHSAQEEEQIKQEQLKKQQKEEEARLEYEKALKEAVYGENQFWKIESDLDIDDLMKDY